MKNIFENMSNTFTVYTNKQMEVDYMKKQEETAMSEEIKNNAMELSDEEAVSAMGGWDYYVTFVNGAPVVSFKVNGIQISCWQDYGDFPAFYHQGNPNSC